jgi:hypothetical protein
MAPALLGIVAASRPCRQEGDVCVKYTSSSVKGRDAAPRRPERKRPSRSSCEERTSDPSAQRAARQSPL